jgi:acyl-CoA synthetase (AMP-forming)/AMP-acid ligase II
VPASPPAELQGPALEDLALLAACGPLTLGGFLLEVCGRHADREALVLDDPLRGGTTVRWSYAALEREARRVARALLAHGLGKGSRVATLMANRPEAVAAFFGAALAGAVVVPLSTFSTRAELAQLLAHSDASVLLAQTTMGRRSFAADLAALAGPGAGPRHDVALPHLRHVFVLGPEADRAGLPGWDDFLHAGDAVPAELVDAVVRATAPSDPGLVIHSSGTTATPKGVLHHHRAPTLQFWLQAGLFGRHEGTRMWSALPLFWTAGINTAMGATLAAGGCWVMQEGFDAGTALQLLERERVTEPYTLPHQATALAEHPDWERTDLSSLRCVFGKSVFARHPTVTGDPGWQMPVGWGMSETCAFICAHPSTSPRETMKASLGTLLPGNRLKVVDPDTGRTVAVGEDGELLVQGPTLMEHYVGLSREECFDRDGWFRTGDVGHVDAAGHVHWTGRRTEMIKSGGANISPAEIEVQLRAHPDVRLARVLAVPDPRLEQVALLCLELVAGAEQDADAITAFLRERVSAYKVPRQVLFFAAGEIPLTASGTKVRDDALRELVAARLPHPTGAR